MTKNEALTKFRQCNPKRDLEFWLRGKYVVHGKGETMSTIMFPDGTMYKDTNSNIEDILSSK